MTWMELAMSGALEEQEFSKAQRLEERIANCGKPLYWYDPIQKRVCCMMPECRHWTCERCNTARANEEHCRIDSAIGQYSYVYILQDVSAADWPRLARKFKSAGITKDMYRRLPQDNSKLVVFFVGSRSLARELKTRTLYNTDNLDWYELARKRQGKRTSGNLGHIEQDGTGEDENLTSVRVVSVRSNTIDGKLHAQAIEHANNIIGERQPHDKTDVQDIIKEWCDAYESFLRELGHSVYRLKCWRKMDLSALQSNTKTKAIKSTSEWFRLAWEGLKDEFDLNQEPVLAF